MHQIHAFATPDRPPPRDFHHLGGQTLVAKRAGCPTGSSHHTLSRRARHSRPPAPGHSGATMSPPQLAPYQTASSEAHGRVWLRTPGRNSARLVGFDPPEFSRHQPALVEPVRFEELVPSLSSLLG